MARLYKFRLVLRDGVVHGERPAGYGNIVATASQSESLIKAWNMKEGEPVHVLGTLAKDEFGVRMFSFTQKDPDPSVGY